MDDDNDNDDVEARTAICRAVHDVQARSLRRGSALGHPRQPRQLLRLHYYYDFEALSAIGWAAYEGRNEADVRSAISQDQDQEVDYGRSGHPQRPRYMPSF